MAASVWVRLFFTLRPMKKIVVAILFFAAFLPQLRAQYDQSQPLPDRPRKIVGLVDMCEHDQTAMSRPYILAIERAGMVPIVLPNTKDSAALSQAIALVDVVMLVGGEDIDPAYFHAVPSPKLGSVNSQRDTFEYRVLDEALGQHKPIVGICRGMQVINVYFGGTLYQDLPSEYPGKLLSHKERNRKAEPVHGMLVEKESFLYRALNTDSLGVNSNHHQAIKEVAEGFVVTGKSPDGVIEAIEAKDYPCVAWQFHPECLAVKNDRIFTQLIGLISTLK